MEILALFVTGTVKTASNFQDWRWGLVLCGSCLVGGRFALSTGYSQQDSAVATSHHAQSQRQSCCGGAGGAPLPTSLAPRTAPAALSPEQPGTLRTNTRSPIPGQKGAGSILSPHDSPLPYQPPMRTRFKVEIALRLHLTAQGLEGNNGTGLRRGRRGETFRKMRNWSWAHEVSAIQSPKLGLPGETSDSSLRLGHKEEMPSPVRGDPGRWVQARVRRLLCHGSPRSCTDNNPVSPLLGPPDAGWRWPGPRVLTEVGDSEWLANLEPCKVSPGLSPHVRPQLPPHGGRDWSHPLFPHQQNLKEVQASWASCRPSVLSHILLQARPSRWEVVLYVVQEGSSFCSVHLPTGVPWVHFLDACCCQVAAEALSNHQGSQLNPGVWSHFLPLGLLLHPDIPEEPRGAGERGLRSTRGHR